MRPDPEPPPEVTIVVDRTFDGITARRVEATLFGAPAGARLVIDVSLVHEIHDFALAVLAHALAHTAAHVSVRGLRHHHVRMLRYFGVDTEQLERAAVGSPP